MAIIKYVVADDHKIFRQGLKLALCDDHKLKCVGEAGNGNELLLLIEKQMPDVMILDIKMPGMGGLEVLDIIRKKGISVKVLVLTMYDDEHFILHLMEAGANGYLLKNAEPDEIKMAIHTLYENDYYFNELVSVTMLRKIIERAMIKSSPNKDINLTQKETDVLRLICMEYTAAEIAKKIFLSHRTVEGIRSTLLEKTGAKNVVGLVLYALRNGIHTN